MEALDPLVKTNSTTLRIPHSHNYLDTLDVAETLDYLLPPSSPKLQCQDIEMMRLAKIMRAAALIDKRTCGAEPSFGVRNLLTDRV